MSAFCENSAIISLQSYVRVFLSKYHIIERRIALMNTIAKKTNSPLIGQIVVYDFKQKLGIMLYKEIDDNNKIAKNFVVLLKKYIPEKYIPHRDYATFELVNNPIKNNKMAKIIAVTHRTPYSYKNLLRQSYKGVMSKNKRDQYVIDFKYHQMSYKTMPFDKVNNIFEEILNKDVFFKLDRAFNAYDITVQ
tara:strand:- start:469 stop:1041 length:573 start_codon:yes stop_codon:yes gene_type:complete